MKRGKTMNQERGVIKRVATAKRRDADQEEEWESRDTCVMYPYVSGRPAMRIR